MNSSSISRTSTLLVIFILFLLLGCFYIFTSDEDYADKQLVTKGHSMNKYNARNQRIRSIFKPSIDKIQSTCQKYDHLRNATSKQLPPSKNFSLGKSNKENNRSLLSSFSISEPKHKLILCRTAKHGSTSWTNNFVKVYKG